MPEIGQNLLHYSLVEKIGKGGMGEVSLWKEKVPTEIIMTLIQQGRSRNANHNSSLRAATA